ncbi:nucleopolyhedrovirus P10 family protein [Streptomyces longispororuber]|uniref:nucleopolyhedrovirus P10 family protein n=1 Tax=Streptomyces longispororuber TaxID=68230 RepID=UPI0036F50052
MTGDGWTSAVRRQLGLGRVLPLGGAGDGAWVTEAAAAALLRRECGRVRGARLTAVRLDLADPDAAYVPSGPGTSPDAYASAVPAPPSALPPGPLRISGDVAAASGEPLPAVADLLRTALATAAADRLGLVVSEVDLRVTALLDGAEEELEEQEPQATSGVGGVAGADWAIETAEAAEAADMAEAFEAGEFPEAADIAEAGLGTGGTATADTDADTDSPEERLARAALAVPGVTRLTGALGGLGRAVHVQEHKPPHSLPRRHVRVELAVAGDRRTLDVARAVRAAVGDALPDRPTVAVLVTAVDEQG